MSWWACQAVPTAEQAALLADIVNGSSMVSNYPGGVMEFVNQFVTVGEVDTAKIQQHFSQPNRVIATMKMSLRYRPLEFPIGHYQEVLKCLQHISTSLKNRRGSICVFEGPVGVGKKVVANSVARLVDTISGHDQGTTEKPFIYHINFSEIKEHKEYNLIKHVFQPILHRYAQQCCKEELECATGEATTAIDKVCNLFKRCQDNAKSAY